jgi:hypothetical protein
MLAPGIIRYGKRAYNGVVRSVSNESRGLVHETLTVPLHIVDAMHMAKFRA